jgi:hypothetical protein
MDPISQQLLGRAGAGVPPATPITYVGYTYSTTASSTSHVLNFPAAAAADDLIIVHINVSGTNTRTFTAPAGWTTLYAGTTAGVCLHAFYKVADGSEGSSVTLTSNSSVQSYGVAYIFKNAKLAGYDGKALAANSGVANFSVPVTNNGSFGIFSFRPRNGVNDTNTLGTKIIDVDFSLTTFTDQNVSAPAVTNTLTQNASGAIEAILIAVEPKDAIPTITYNGNSVDTTDSNNYTLSGVSIGTAAYDRLVVVLVQVSGGSSTFSINSVNIGGVAATAHASAGGTNQFAAIGVYSRIVPTGTTASIDVTTSATAGRCMVASYSLYDLESFTAEDANAVYPGTSPYDDILTGLSSDACVATLIGSDGTSVSVSEATTDLSNLSLESGARVATAASTTTTAAGDKTLTYTMSSATYRTATSVAFR